MIETAAAMAALRAMALAKSIVVAVMTTAAATAEARAMVAW